MGWHIHESLARSVPCDDAAVRSRLFAVIIGKALTCALFNSQLVMRFLIHRNTFRFAVAVTRKNEEIQVVVIYLFVTISIHVQCCKIAVRSVPRAEVLTTWFSSKIGRALDAWCSIMFEYFSVCVYA